MLSNTKSYLIDSSIYTSFYFFWQKEVFSQWYIRPFRVNGTTFNCCEQYMMYQKAILFNDKAVADQILKTMDPKKQKALGRKVKSFDNKTWEENRDRIVYEGNYAKFTQHDDLLQELLKHKNVEYVEASPYDKIWGIGLEDTHPDALNKKTWKGLNLLGRVLTQLREDLLQEREK